MASDLTKRLSEQGIHISLTDSAQEKIADEGFDPEYGARPLTNIQILLSFSPFMIPPC